MYHLLGEVWNTAAILALQRIGAAVLRNLDVLHSPSKYAASQHKDAGLGRPIQVLPTHALVEPAVGAPHVIAAALAASFCIRGTCDGLQRSRLVGGTILAVPPNITVTLKQEKPAFTPDWERTARIMSLVAIPEMLAIIGAAIQATLGRSTVSGDYVQLAVSILTAEKVKNAS